MEIFKRLREVYASPKSTLVGAAAGVAGIALIIVFGGSDGWENMDWKEIAGLAGAFIAMVAGALKKDK